MNPTAAEQQSDINPVLRGCRVLLVEDERIIREILIRQLRKIGIRKIAEAPSAESAWAALVGPEAKSFHVIITDLTLPGVSGTALIKNIRSLPGKSAKTMPIIVLTGDDSLKTYQSLARCNVSAYLLKPVSPHILRSTIERALGLAETTSVDGSKADTPPLESNSTSAPEGANNNRKIPHLTASA